MAGHGEMRRGPQALCGQEGKYVPRPVCFSYSWPFYLQPRQESGAQVKPSPTPGVFTKGQLGTDRDASNQTEGGQTDRNP